MSQDSLRNLLVEAQILIPSYTHYGGLSGFQDYGIIGSRIKRRFLDLWRKHFLTDRTEEVEIPDIVPYPVLKASGHVDKFTDPVVEYNGVFYRADHLLKDEYKRIGKDEGEVDTYDNSQLEKEINASEGIKEMLAKTATIPGLPVHPGLVQHLKVQYKSLMLCIGQGNEYLMRPEIAQTIYPNFRRYYDYHRGKLPFAIAQTGRSYRNEICPKPFERLRSFHQAEIEYFFDPKEGYVHPGWSKVKDKVIPMLSANNQLNGLGVESKTLEQALNAGEIKDGITATFMGKVAVFVQEIGIKSYRFRQHLPTEMAHYAKDCWDLECMINEGGPDAKWLECVGIANRGDYDLRVHDKNGQFLVKSGEPIDKEVLNINIGYIKKTYKALSSQVIAELRGLDLSKLSFPYTCTNGLVLDKNIIQTTKVKEFETFYPHVIEPSFGVDRLIYVMMAQNYWLRPNTNKTPDNDDPNQKGEETREVISLAPALAPYDVAVLQLSNNEKLLELTDEVTVQLKAAGLQVFTDPSGTSIGKRYVRTDRIGIPYAVTIDFESLTDGMVTIRNRDGMEQLRVPIKELNI